MRDIESETMINIQKINDDDTNSAQKDPIICKQGDTLYSFWSDNRNGNYEIYFSKGLNELILLGDTPDFGGILIKVNEVGDLQNTLSFLV